MLSPVSEEGKAIADPTANWPTASTSQTDTGPGPVSGTPAAASPSAQGHYWARFVAASLALLYLSGVTIGWATNMIDGY